MGTDRWKDGWDELMAICMGAWINEWEGNGRFLAGFCEA